ncbi:putative transmembrane protein [Apostichopus japonicus]|uniref:Putative transmembrane protein n=1 Tax=Stichopus japonicus TaxID=307972 RepID=A0A2G8K4X7_STIJA|nr:putative transmembrane protein [Apostichopus japonicus]
MHLVCSTSNLTDFAVSTESDILGLSLTCVNHLHRDPYIMLLEEIQQSLDWVCGGVDPNLEGNGGPACVQFLPPVQRLLETLLIAFIALLEMAVTWPHLKVPSHTEHNSGGAERPMKKVLLVLLCLTLGVEIGLKFASRTIIYILNPCHMLSIVQIYLLAAPPSKTVAVVFRMQMVALHGPFLALVLPVLNTRLLPCETMVYWLQHILIYFVIPPYLMKIGGVYTTEPLSKFSWCMFTTGFMFLYHLVFLQALGMLLEVNLNNVICPATSDPFYGRWYRMCALIHQHALVPVHEKIYTFFALLLLPRRNQACNGEIMHKEE